MLAGCIVLLALCSVLSGCRLPNELPVTPDQNYFPLETGRYIIYEVQENLYVLHTEPVQRSYQLKEVTGVAYTDVTGQTAFPLRRYRRATADQPWQADSLWSARLVTNEAIRTENSQDVVSLLIPISNGLRWNGNRHNSYDVEMYEARNVDQPFRVLTKLFNETATVVAQDDSTLVSQEKRLAVYAREVGLIYKERTSLQFCTALQTCVGKNQIDYGTRQIYRIKTYGKE
ncbi:hypothetical protein [Spirosoma pollinicola]|uniref:hypothetical protein n=1 Tax=Spirosoma pollinicola TaxID=2057025 RepID=UPI001F0CC949|nr:hypothetical protein [Spirosoma pollinicola]